MPTNLSEVTLHVYLNVTEISGLDENDARNLFGHATIEFSVEGGRICHTRSKSIEFLREPHSEITTIPTSRLREYEQILRENGYEPIGRRQDSYICAADLSSVTDQSPWVQGCAASISEHPVGRITINRDTQRKDCVRLICQLFAEANVVLVVESQKKCQEFVTFLGRFMPERVTTSYANLTAGSKRVIVLCEPTYALLNPDCINVVVFPNLVKALAKKILQDTISLTSHRIYAIEVEGLKLDSDQDLKASYLAGGRIFGIGSPTRGSVLACLIGVASCLCSNGRGRLEDKRSHVWENQPRNQRIAEIADGLINGANQLNFPFPQELRSEAIRVAIVVESSEHARILQCLLPSWRTLARRGNISGPQAWTVPDRCIVTRAWAESQTNLEIDVLIRADGDDSKLNLPCFPPLCSPDCRTFLLIDVYNENRPDARLSLVHHYRDEGYRIY